MTCRRKQPWPYERFVRAAEDYDEVGFARRHKGFRLKQWEQFVDVLSTLRKSGSGLQIV
jgi:hypothetical protein